MTEVCFCGRTGDLADRTPIIDDGGPGLRCPRCGHLDRLAVFPERVRIRIWTQAKDREVWPLGSTPGAF